MGRVVVSEFVSLDGVMEGPGGEGYKYAGWTFKFDRGAEGDRFKLDELTGAEALLLGRVTYEGFAEAWPSRTGPFADKLNAMPKYVVSSTLREGGWANTTVLAGDPLKAISELRESLGGDILVAGSCRLVHALIEHDLVDELRLMVFPILLGEGKRLFGEVSAPKRLRLTDSRTSAEVLLQTFQPAPVAAAA